MDLHRSEPREVFHTMHAQHLQIDAALKQMGDLITGDDREAMRVCWSKLEDAVLAHLDLEEMHFLPAIAKKDPGHARAVRSEHDLIRAQMGEIGLALDLHTARAEQVEALSALLRNHARLEEQGLYAMAERELSAEVKRSVLKRLRDSFVVLMAN